MKFSEYKYERPDLDQAKAEFYGYIDAIKNADSYETLKENLDKLQALQNDLMTLQELVGIRASIDSRDEFYEAEQAFWDEHSPIVTEWFTDFYRAILNSSYLDQLKEDLPGTFFKLAENSLKSFDPKVIELIQEENRLVTEYNRLIASAEIEYKGKTYNLPGLGKFAQDPDRQVRKEVAALNSKFFADNQAKIDEIYDRMVKVRDKIAKDLGFKDFVELGYVRMDRLDYNRRDVETYRQEILKHVVPLDQELYARQAKRLGLDALKSYDLPLEFKEGNATPVGTSDEILANGVKMYHEMSPETGEFIDFMVDHELLDLVTKPGKQGGGYCTYIPGYQSPFIFSNFNGTSGDVDVLTHEAGHAFQVYSSRWIQSPECVWPTFESCEIHSMSMEFFAYPWMKDFFQDQEQKYKYSHLMGTVTFLPYGVLVDHFQHEVYEHPEMTPAERRATWRRLEKQYNPWKDFDGDEFLEAGGFWFRQGHIFSSPFYYIDYTLAQVCALQFWKRQVIDHDPKAWEDYLAICRAGGTLSFRQIVEKANLKSPFEKGNLEGLVNTIRDYLAAIPESDLV